MVKKIAIVLFLYLLMTNLMTASYAYDNIPEKVRIGLYYERSGVSSIDISSVSGFRFTYERDGQFVTLFEYSDSNHLEVRKDAYFVKTGDGVVEYWPNLPNIPSGKKYGPYHIQIGKDYENYEDAKRQMNVLAKKGIKVFPAFYNGFYKVWTGLYTSEGEAQEELDDIQKTSGQQDCFIIPPGAARVQVLSSGNQEVVFIFDSTSWYLTIQPLAEKDKPPIININGKNYRGGVEFKRLSDSDMTVINVLDFEEYLYGVLPKEMGGGWPLEALKAQAVAARTYAVLHMNKYQKFGFNMCATTASQAYAGYDVEHPRCTKAVQETSGKVLTYQGKPAYVYYFSTSGGHTEDVRNVWGGSGTPYLTGVKDNYEDLERADRAKWEVGLTPEQMKEILKAQGYDVGDILSVTVTEYSQSGRVVKLKITGTKRSYTFEKSKTRSIFGANFLNSQKYSIHTDSDIYIMGQNTENKVPTTTGEVKVRSKSGVGSVKRSMERIYTKGANTKKSYAIVPTYYTFIGKGWGHGVGLSQWGARGMAEAGFTYDEILMHYFPGTKVE